MPTTDARITPKHQQTLEESGIDLQAAKDWGIRSITAPDGYTGTDLDTPANHARRGLLFPLRRLDGSVTYQLRLDEPEGDRKYVQAFDTGSILNVPALMADRIETAERVLIIEGTKQTIVTSLLAPATTLVVGIQGARNWSSGGVPMPELHEFFKPGREVILGFDADWQTNRNVWEAAKALKNVADTTTGGNARMLTTPGGKNTGIDDFLGSIKDAASRPGVLENLIKAATDKLGRPPAAKKPKTSIVTPADAKVNWDKGIIERTVVIKDPVGGDTERSEIALNAAAKIIETEAHIDEETGETHSQVLTLLVRVPTLTGDEEEGAGPTVRDYTVKIPSANLANVREWVDRLPGGVGVSIPSKTKPDDDVANAIRTFETDYTSITVVPHLGWTFDISGDDDNPDGLWRWCDGAGAIGPVDKSTRLRGEPGTRDFQSIDLPEPPSHLHNDTQLATYQEQVRNLIMAREHLRADKRFSWDVGVAAWGLAFLGITPNAALCYFGPPSSGKSTIAQALTSSLHKGWAPRSGSAMSTFNASATGIDLLPNGMRDVFLHVDDLRPEADRKGMEQTLKAFDALLRRAHGSGGRVRGEVSRSGSGLGVRKIDPAAPMMVVTGEEIPSGDGFAESGLDRALFITVKPNTLFTSVGLSKLEALAASGELRLATSAYVAWIAGQITARTSTTDSEGNEGVHVAPADRLKVWRADVDRLRTELAASMESGSDESGGTLVFPPDLKVSSRARLLAASLALGQHMVLEFATEAGAITPAEREQLWSGFCTELAEAVKTHTREVMGGNESTAEVALSAIRNAVASREVTLDPTEPHKPLIGEFRSDLPGVGKAVVINHAAAARALRWSGGARNLQRSLADLTEPTADGQPTRTMRINGARVQVCVISEENWGAEVPASSTGEGF